MAIGDIKAGRAYVEIGTDNTDLNKGLAGAQAKVKAFSDSLKSTRLALGGAFAAAAVVATLAIKKFAQTVGEAAEFASHLDDAARRVGVTTEELQELSFAAKRTGVEASALEDAVAQLVKRMGKGEISDELRKIGLSLNELKQISPHDAFLLVVDSLGQVKNESDRAAIAVELFGRGGQELNGILQAGSENLKQMANEARAMGAVVGKDVVNELANLGDKIDDVKQAWEGFKASFSSGWASTLASNVLDTASEVMSGGDAMTETFNSVELFKQRFAADMAQGRIDQQVMVQLAQAQADEAERQRHAQAGTAAMMEETLQSMEAMVGPAKELVNWAEKRQQVLEAGRRIFEMTRTPEENAETAKQQARDAFLGGAINIDTFKRRFAQILASLPSKMASVSTSAAGTFNPAGIRGLGDNKRLTEIAEEQLKVLRQIKNRGPMTLV